MKAVVAAFNQEKALVGAFSVITNLRMELFEALEPRGPGEAELCSHCSHCQDMTQAVLAHTWHGHTSRTPSQDILGKLQSV